MKLEVMVKMEVEVQLWIECHNIFYDFFSMYLISSLGGNEKKEQLFEQIILQIHVFLLSSHVHGSAQH